MITNQQIHLVSRPATHASVDNFTLVEATVPELKADQVLVRHHFLSLDPYMRGRMDDAKSYAAPQPLNAVMLGGTVGEVVASTHAGYAVGDMVVGFGGWQQFSVVDAGTRACCARWPRRASPCRRTSARRDAWRDGLVRPDQDLQASRRPDHRRQRGQRRGRECRGPAR